MFRDHVSIIENASVIEARGVWANSFETPFNSLAGDYVDFAYPADGYVGNGESGKWQSPLRLQAVPMAFHYMNIDPIGPIMSGSTVVHPMISHIQAIKDLKGDWGGVID